MLRRKQLHKLIDQLPEEYMCFFGSLDVNAKMTKKLKETTRKKK